MRRERVGEIRRKHAFEATTVKIAAETRDCADPKRNPVAISLLTPSFSDVP